MASPEVISEQRHMIRGLSRTVTGPNIRIVKVKVVQGLNLAKKDIFGLSDPYCMIKLFGSSRHTDNIVTLQTPVRKKTLNPKWNSSFSLRVNTEDHSLSFEIYDENRITRDDFLGEVIVSLKNIPEEEGSSAALPPKDYLLQGRSQKSRVKGHIRVSLVLQREEAATNNTLDESDGIAARHIRNDLNSGESYPSGSSVAPERPDEPGWEAVNHEDVEENIAEISRQPSVSFSEIEPLPEGWEERQDANGRTFYVNHNTRSTTWVRPTALSDANAIETSNNDVSELARSFSYRRHISVEAAAGPSTAATGLPPGWEERRNANGQVLYIDHNSRTTSWVRPRSQSHLNDDAPPTSDSVESQRQRRISERLHPDVPSQSEMALPAGWAMQLADNGRVFFIDHNSRKTCWVDPRINPQEIDAADLGPLPAGWEERVHSDGRVFFIDHETQSTQWEDPRLQIKAKEKSEAVPYSRDYKRKYDYFRSRLKRPEKVPNKYEIHVRRTSLLDDSYGFVLSRCTNVDLLKTKLWIVFEGEVGLDYGGVQREWFYVLSKEIFNPYYGLFEYSASDNYTLQINPYSGLCNDQHLSYFKFIGRVAGMAMYHGKLLDGFFIRPFYKMMLGKKITLQDMESVDSEYHNSLKYLIDNDPEDLELYFQVEEETFGQIVATELKPGGENIRVTNSNKQEYIDLVIKWRFNDRVAEQMKSFMEGLEDLIPLQLLQLFDENEIEYLLCGLGEIDVDDWRKNTIYRNGYHDKHVVVTWFWKAVSNFDNEMKARLLQFVTGTSRVPMNGFAELYGSNGPQKFAIERWGNSHQLPKSHTCFNRIDLPQYNSYHELREKLRLAIENTEGFDGVD